MSVVDLTPRLREKHDRDLQARRPTRDPDFELHGWLEGGEVDWSFFGCRDEAQPVLANHFDQVAACIDAAWNIAAATHDHDGPAIWFTLDQQGHHTLLWRKDLVTGTSWRHAWWLIKQWWRLSVRWWRLIRRAARGRG